MAKATKKKVATKKRAVTTMKAKGGRGGKSKGGKKGC